MPMIRSFLPLGALLFLLAACDGTGPRGVAPAPEPDPDPDPAPVQLRGLVIDQFNNNTDETSAPVDINDLEFEIDRTPIDLDTVTG